MSPRRASPFALAILLAALAACASSGPAAPGPPAASGGPAAPTPAAPTATPAMASPAVPAVSAPAPARQGPPADAQLVEYAPGRHGFLYRPTGAGPFPVVVWNHGSEKLPGWRTELAHFYVEHGWAFFLPHRRGHGRSPGPYIGDEHDDAKVTAMQDEHNQDVVAAIAWIKTQSGIDAARVVVSGCSFGGIQTLITAGQPVGIRAAVPFAPGAIMWARTPTLRDRLVRAAREAKVPVFLVQAANDFDVSPSKIVGAELEKAHLGHRVQIYPAYGTTAMEGHGKFCAQGFAVWGNDVLVFLDQATAPPAAPSKH